MAVANPRAIDWEIPRVHGPVDTAPTTVAADPTTIETSSQRRLPERSAMTATARVMTVPMRTPASRNPWARSDMANSSLAKVAV